MSQNFVQAQPFTLAGAGAVLGATSLILTSFKKLDGTDLLIADFGSKGFCTIEPGSSENEEAITFTGVTQNANGTATLTGVKNQLTETPYTETSGLAKTHVGGTTLIITNTAGFYNEMTSNANDEIVTGQWQFTQSPWAPTPTSVEGTAVATVDYVNGVAIAGAPDATTTTKGISKLSTAAATATNPIVVGTNDTRVPTQAENDALVGTRGTPSSTNVFVTASDVAIVATASLIVRGNTSGKIDRSWLLFGGTGADGALAITSGTTTINLGGAATVVKNYTSISITSTGALAFSNPHANGTAIIFKSQGNITLTSSAIPNIDLRGTGAVGGAGGPTTATAGARGYGGGGGAGAGGSGTDGTAGVTGSNAGNAGSRGQGMIPTGGGNPSATAAVGTGGTLPFLLGNLSFPYTQFIPIVIGAGGAGGGSGESNDNSVAIGGTGAGVLVIQCAGAWNFTSTINGSGNNGVNANTRGGGGGGGGAGSVIVLYNTLTANSGSVSASGGTGGSGNSGGGVGGNGGTGVVLIASNTEFA